MSPLKQNTVNATIAQKQLLSLLRAGLWDIQADESLFPNDTDWMPIFLLAKQQAILGIVFDGMQTLPKKLHPDRGIYLQWCSIVDKIERENHWLNEELNNVFSLYKKNGITPVLLKGQGAAQNYRIPEHRQSGDIDVYVGKENYATANFILRIDGKDQHEENHKHTSIEWHGVFIENHRIVSHLNAPRANQCFQKAVSQWFPHGGCETNIDGCNVLVPPVDFNIVYILIHSVLHYLNEGVGLRQICDWICLLHAQQQKMNSRAVCDFLEQIGFLKVAKAFGAIAVSQLGLPKEELPFQLSKQDEERGEQLLEDVFLCGNFGRYDPQWENRPKGYWRGKWYTFCRTQKRTHKFRDLVPAEARWRMFTMTVEFIQAQIRKRLP